MISNAKKILYLPIEHVQRELDGKLLVAIEAASRGYSVILGKLMVFAALKHDLLPGLFLYKDTAGWRAAKDFPILKRRGCKVFALDEEGIIFTSPESYARHRVDEKAVSSVDKIFAWGTYQAYVLSQFAKVSEEKILIVGNPRIDLLRLHNNTKKTKNSDFTILINTRFTAVNGLRSSTSRLQNLKRLGLIKTQADIDNAQISFERQKDLFQRFLKLIKTICKDFSYCQVIVRPHPGEAEEIYRKLSEEHSNLVVDKTTPLVKQLSESSVMIHESCTTAIEASVLNKPIISFVPVEPFSKTLSISNEFGVICKTEKETIEQIHKIKNSKNDNVLSQTEKIKSYIENFDGEYSFKKIVDEFDKYDVPSFGIEKVQMQIEKNRISIEKIKSLVKKFVCRHPKGMSWLLGKTKIRLILEGTEIEKKSFPDFDAESMFNRASSITELLSYQTENLKVTRIKSGLYGLTFNP